MLGVDGESAPTRVPVLNPADRRDVVGDVRDATPEDVAGRAGRGRAMPQPRWAAIAAAERAPHASKRAADLLEADMPSADRR